MTYIRKVMMRDPKLSVDYMYKKLNKLYKQIDYSKDYIGLQDAIDILKDENIFFLSLATLENKGLITKFKAGKHVYIPTDEIEQEMLRRELCCYKDRQLFETEKNYKEYGKIIKYRSKFTRKQKVWLRINGEKWFAGEYPEARMGKVKKVMQYFYKNKHLFDKKSSRRLRRPTFVKLFKYLFNKGLDNFDLDKWWKGTRKA